MVIIAAMLASIWPARKALKLQAAEAVRDDS
jgi:ABC-type lipoprotein release transport system permease subunit